MTKKKRLPGKLFEVVPLEKLKHILAEEEIEAAAEPAMRKGIRDEKREPYSITPQDLWSRR